MKKKTMFQEVVQTELTPEERHREELDRLRRNNDRPLSGAEAEQLREQLFGKATTATATLPVRVSTDQVEVLTAAAVDTPTRKNTVVSMPLSTRSASVPQPKGRSSHKTGWTVVAVLAAAVVMIAQLLSGNSASTPTTGTATNPVGVQAPVGTATNPVGVQAPVQAGTAQAPATAGTGTASATGQAPAATSAPSSSPATGQAPSSAPNAAPAPGRAPVSNPAPASAPAATQVGGGAPASRPGPVVNTPPPANPGPVVNTPPPASNPTPPPANTGSGGTIRNGPVVDPTSGQVGGQPQLPDGTGGSTTGSPTVVQF